MKIRRPYLYLLIASIIMAGSIICVRYLNAFNLQEVEISPQKLTGNKNILKSEMGINLFALPIDKITDRLLGNDKVHKVDINYDIPGKVQIQLNEMIPLALVLTNNGRTLYGINHDGIVHPYDYEKDGLDYPIITGLKNSKMYHRYSGKIVSLVLKELEHIKNTDTDTYLSMSNIDLSQDDKVVLRLEGLPFAVLTDSGSIQKSITKLKIFLMGHNHDLTQIEKLDLRTDGLIIAVD